MLEMSYTSFMLCESRKGNIGTRANAPNTGKEPEKN